jgi:hypothetical protein
MEHAARQASRSRDGAPAFSTTLNAEGKRHSVYSKGSLPLRSPQSTNYMMRTTGLVLFLLPLYEVLLLQVPPMQYTS